MRRLLLILMLPILAACTPDDVKSALHLLHGSPRAYISFEADVSGETNIPDALDQAAAVVQRRLDLAGVDAEARGYSGETAVIVVQGYTDDPEGLISLVTQGGRVEFVDLRNAPPELTAQPNDAPIATTAHPTQGEHTDPITGAPYATVLDAVQVIDAQAIKSQYTDSWEVLLTFSPEHGAILSAYTAANIGTTLGILIDARLLAAPIIQVQVGEQALIAGNFTEAEVREMAAVVGGGVLPFDLSVSEVR